MGGSHFIKSMLIGITNKESEGLKQGRGWVGTKLRIKKGKLNSSEEIIPGTGEGLQRV